MRKLCVSTGFMSMCMYVHTNYFLGYTYMYVHTYYFLGYTYMYVHTYYFLGYKCMYYIQMHTCTCILIFTHRAHLHRRGDPTSI